jgi:hypothetical protein
MSIFASEIQPAAPTCCNRSPPRNCSHKSVPFVEAAAKAKVAGGVEI